MNARTLKGIAFRGRFVGLKFYVAAITFLTGILVARGLGEESFAQYALLVIYGNLLSIACGMSVSAYCVYVQVNKTPQEIAKVAGNILVTYAGAALILAGSWAIVGLAADFLLYLALSFALVMIFWVEGIFRSHERAFLGFIFDQALRPTLIIAGAGGLVLGWVDASLAATYGAALGGVAVAALVLGRRYFASTAPKIEVSLYAWARQLRFASAQIAMLLAINVPFLMADLLYDGDKVAVMRGAQMLLNIVALINMSVIQPKLALVRALAHDNKITELNAELRSQVRLLIPLNLAIACLTLLLAGVFNRHVLQIEHDFWIVALYVLIYSTEFMVFPLDQIYAQLGRSIQLAIGLFGAVIGAFGLIWLFALPLGQALLFWAAMIVVTRLILAVRLARDQNIRVGILAFGKPQLTG